MENKKTLSLKDPDILFLSYFGVGFFPFAPGTAGTLATLPIIFLIGKCNESYLFYLPFIILLTLISCFVAEYTQKRKGLHDPSWIVMDEVIGMLITWLFYCGTNYLHIAILFGLFRFFDIIKIWPASYFDKKVKHGAGTILDDVISALFAGVCHKIILYFFSF